ncbi:hypothetical protein [Spirosoma sp. KNUC1025]|uniref:hypothetical protein n=1 Tax=Spirosoma sp. KNUC1025 TaxID=2894082 RepID=UPI00386FF57E|nr:hypothetical protein LN737_21345 [Spirosoma sp. KNUC1025]
MRLILLAGLTLLLSCHKESSLVNGNVRNEAARIFANNLAVDGCEEMVRLEVDSSLNNFIGYKPSPSTLPLVQKALAGTSPGHTGRAVTIRFFETGKQVSLQCGWGNAPQVPEIEVLEITPR